MNKTHPYAQSFLTVVFVTPIFSIKYSQKTGEFPRRDGSYAPTLRLLSGLSAHPLGSFLRPDNTLSSSLFSRRHPVGATPTATQRRQGYLRSHCVEHIFKETPVFPGCPHLVSADDSCIAVECLHRGVDSGDHDTIFLKCVPSFRLSAPRLLSFRTIEHESCTCFHPRDGSGLFSFEFTVLRILATKHRIELWPDQNHPT